ncbi:hypothetical protein [Microbacterium sp. Leaf179]|uniref:hypothetical protein n=1 Tax=Microbacterium sp. Leaf179 TaxID=1736288 RepID=UPI0006F8599D|nr:hypothetical protein [Microbacterium sp. Leaf179]KQR86338.1 hypothetical protein ASF96_08075 [Microbacterium sp. Leaf179]
MALREAAQEAGRKGVLKTKTWLESTTHIQLPFDVYNFTSQCAVTCLDDSVEAFDLNGLIHTRNVPLYVENKAYTAVGNQAKAFDEFLAIAYSSTAKEIARVGDWKAEFMWVTTHPFSQTVWPTLTKRERMAQALAEDEHNLLNGEAVDDALLTLVAQRVWLLVLSDRQHELTLSAAELFAVQGALTTTRGK